MVAKWVFDAGSCWARKGFASGADTFAMRLLRSELERKERNAAGCWQGATHKRLQSYYLCSFFGFTGGCVSVILGLMATILIGFAAGYRLALAAQSLQGGLGAGAIEMDAEDAEVVEENPVPVEERL